MRRTFLRAAALPRLARAQGNPAPAPVPAPAARAPLARVDSNGTFVIGGMYAQDLAPSPQRGRFRC